MGKGIFDVWGFAPDLGYRPPPPTLPKYDPNEDAPKWDWTRLRWRLTPVAQEHKWPRVGDLPAADDLPDWRGVVKNNVIELPMPGKYPFGPPTDPNYFWFDTPDYADPFKKLWYSTKFFFKVGLLALSTYGLLENKKFSWKYHWSLTSRVFVPVFVGGMTASLTVLTVSNLRGKKDDYYNYVAGGLVAACVVGRRHYLSWVRHTVMWTPLAVYTKHMAETNDYLLPVINPRQRNFGLSGMSTEQGIRSGDLRCFAPKGNNTGDPGRDVRTFA